MIRLTVNGEAKEFAQVSTVRDLILRLNLTGRAVAVEVNKQLIAKRQHDTHRLADGDVVELVTLVGGG